MAEFITIQVGQCGNQIGSALWPLLLEEYGILSPSTVSSSNPSFKLDASFNSFFNCPEGVSKISSLMDLRKRKVTARALLIDMEERVVERFRCGGLHHIFDRKCSLVNHPGSGNNWAVGHHTHFKAHRLELEDMLRHSAEQCDSLRGALVLLSLGGGTGAGLGTAVLRQLEDMFPHIGRFVTCVHPGEYNDVVTSPYNIAHSLRLLSEHASCVIPVDNKALTDICNRHRLNTGVRPFQDVNGLIVNMLLNLTSGSRFSGSLNCDMSDLITLVPQPGLHFLSASYSPLDLRRPRDLSYANKQRNLVNEVCAREDQLIRVNALGGRVLSAALLCRGNLSLSTLRDYVERFRSKVKFAGWSDPGVKAGLCSVSQIGHKSAMLCLVNSSNMATLFTDSLRHFNRLYNRKAHTHHYINVDGFEEEDFVLTKESLMSSAEKYSTAAKYLEVPRLKVS